MAEIEATLGRGQGGAHAAANLPGTLRAVGRAAGLAVTIGEMVVRARAEDAAGPPSARLLAERTQRAACVILERHGVVVVPGSPAPRGPAIVVANHASYLDPLVVASALPCIAIAKGETDSWPLVGKGLRTLGVLFVRRGDAHSGAVTLRRALRALGSGASILNFPEGTTTDGRQVGPFRRGVFGLARWAQLPVVPAWIGYDDPRVAWYGGVAFVPHYASLARTRHTVARVRFGEPLTALPSDDPTALAEQARARVAALGQR